VIVIENSEFRNASLKGNARSRRYRK